MAILFCRPHFTVTKNSTFHGCPATQRMLRLFLFCFSKVIQLGRELETQVAEWKEVEASHEKHVTELNVKIEQYEQLIVQLRNEIHVTEQNYNVTINESNSSLRKQIEVWASVCVKIIILDECSGFIYFTLNISVWYRKYRHTHWMSQLEMPWILNASVRGRVSRLSLSFRLVPVRKSPLAHIGD